MSIDRINLVGRHDVIVKKFDEYSPLSVGNGELAFTVDSTGFQTFSDFYDKGIPLCTQSQWGWHTTPFSADSFYPEKNKFKHVPYDTGGRSVDYPSSSIGQEKEYDWLRQNPHRLNLCNIGLDVIKDDGQRFSIDDIEDIEQHLNLYEGMIESSYSIDGTDVYAKTCCHPALDMISFSVNSRLLSRGRIKFILRFPYGSPHINASAWDDNYPFHSTRIISNSGKTIDLLRVMDKDRYFVRIFCAEGTIINKIGENSFELIPSTGNEIFAFSALFSRIKPEQSHVTFNETLKACKRYWEIFWNHGGMMDFSASVDARAFELERRIVLSQYLTAIQCSGTTPPQETGLTCNSWYGKFHLEMHWFHASHFTLWERPHLLERSMWWYLSIMDQAKSVAKSQGYAGARWPKMTSPGGEESPSPIGPFIIWQQPHPIYFAELIYRSDPSSATLDIYKDMVFQTADFISSFVRYDEKTGYYELIPPIIPAQENHKPENTLNPSFELEYWHFALSTANIWKKRLGLEPDARWEEVANKLAMLPVHNGSYIAHKNCPDTFENFNFDHPSMLATLGMLPGTRVDKKIMNDTLDRVMRSWQMDKTWGWDFPLIAMTAARLDRPELAIDALLYDSPKNIYLANGHNMQGGVKELPIYLPGNGALLFATGMMAAGWCACTTESNEKRNAPGFPDNGKWKVKWENIKPVI